MKENISYMIEALCFEFGNGFPERNGDNFNGEWFNLSYFDFYLTFNSLVLRSSGDQDGPYKNSAVYNGSLVYKAEYDYIQDDEFPCLNETIYIPGEWENILYEKYRRLPIPSREQITFKLMDLIVKNKVNEQMDFAEISDEFYF
ncbi:hypothetical protein HYW74_01065 [Candidatus Pacearchaeota archaeon]|nr:hypothetical protein [Candidatus Pacearchaeota archaeon]